MIYVLLAGLGDVPSKAEGAALEELLPFLTGERTERFDITRTTLRHALTRKQWYDFTFVVAPNIYEAQDAFVEALDLLDHCEELRFLVRSDGVFKLASGNRLYHIPKAGIVRFSGATSLSQAARLLDIMVSELTYVENLPLPAVGFGDLFKTDAIVGGSRSLKSNGMEVEFKYGDTKRQAHMQLASYRFNLYAEQLDYEEWHVEFNFTNYGDGLPVLSNCVFWSWLVENALKAFVRLDDETTARIVAGFPVFYEPLVD